MWRSFVEFCRRRPGMGTPANDDVFLVSVLGDVGVGKSSLMERLATGRFNAACPSTLGLDVRSRRMTLPTRGNVVTLQLWETGGAGMVTSDLYRDAHGVVFMYDPGRPDTLAALSAHVRSVERYGQGCAKLLVAGRLDQYTDQLRAGAPGVVPISEAKLRANEWRASLALVSARDGTGVEQAFAHLAEAIVDGLRGASAPQAMRACGPHSVGSALTPSVSSATSPFHVHSPHSSHRTPLEPSSLAASPRQLAELMRPASCVTPSARDIASELFGQCLRRHGATLIQKHARAHALRSSIAKRCEALPVPHRASPAAALYSRAWRHDNVACASPNGACSPSLAAGSSSHGEVRESPMREGAPHVASIPSPPCDGKSAYKVKGMQRLETHGGRSHASTSTQTSASLVEAAAEPRRSPSGLASSIQPPAAAMAIAERMLKYAPAPTGQPSAREQANAPPPTYTGAHGCSLAGLLGTALSRCARWCPASDERTAHATSVPTPTPDAATTSTSAQREALALLLELVEGLPFGALRADAMDSLLEDIQALSLTANGGLLLEAAPAAAAASRGGPSATATAHTEPSELCEPRACVYRHASLPGPETDRRELDGLGAAMMAARRQGTLHRFLQGLLDADAGAHGRVARSCVCAARALACEDASDIVFDAQADDASAQTESDDNRLSSDSDDDVEHRVPKRASELQTNAPSLEAAGVLEYWSQQANFGEGVIVGVVDTGCDLLHPELLGQVIAARDFTRGPQHERVGAPDYDGHGTHCCGIIAARKDGRGMVGVAPHARLVVAKILAGAGSEVDPQQRSASTVQIARALEWCAAQGCDVISMSWGSFSGETAADKIYGHVLTRLARERGIVFVAAAGNHAASYGHIAYPAAHPDVIACGNFDPARGAVNQSSSRGEGLFAVAPGTEYMSTDLHGSFTRRSGTSMAAPFLAGSLALLISRARQQREGVAPSREELIAAVRRLALDQGPQGWDRDSGFGLVQLLRE